ncbi:MAG TPA: hypothetical protein VIV15_11740 [Anaerolineales bacterium]
MLTNIKHYIAQESLAARRERMLLAALYGALIASAYIWSLTLVNVLSFPKLPLGIDWGRTLGMWAGYVLGFALFGAIAGWFTEEYEGIVGGAVIATVLVAILLLFTSGARSSTLTARAIITALPLVGVAMLGAWILRWAARHHMDLARERLRGKLIQHVLIVALIGLVPGVLGRMDLTAEQRLTEMNQLLLAAPKDPSVWPRLPLDKFPALLGHLSGSYRLYPRRSTNTVGNLDVTIRFGDGYALTCSVPVASGATFINDCVEGGG